MIISVAEFKKYVKTTETDEVLEAKLQALELLVRTYTNNNFQLRAFRTVGSFKGGALHCDTSLFVEGDTIQISQSELNEGLMVVKDMTDGVIPCIGCFPEDNVLVTKVKYPADVQMGVVNMLKWDLQNRDKVGIQAETLSRHSVTYFNMDGENSVIGYPKSLLGFLKPYMKARF